MKILFRLLTVVMLLVPLTANARQWTPSQVKQLVKRVNTYWQQNNKPQVRAFWDNAAYHTGNIEAYRLLGDQ